MPAPFPWRTRNRHVAVVMGIAGVLALVAARGMDTSATDRSAALAKALGKRGLGVAAGDVQWLDGPRGLWGAWHGGARAIVRAAPAIGEPNDIFLVEADLSPEGVLLDAGVAYNLSETSSADESRPILSGEHVAYLARALAAAGGSVTVHEIDLHQQPAVGGDWTRLERSQNAITNWQQTGRLRGVGKRTLSIDPKGEEKHADAPQAPNAVPSDASLAFDADVLVLRSAGREARIPADFAANAALPDWLELENSELARPGNLVTWAVDRVRAIPWVGDDTMQVIKTVAFTGLDFIESNKERVTGDTGAADIASDLGQSQLDPPVRQIPVDTEIGWPPAPLEPWVNPPLPGEGTWNPQDRDPFVRTNEGLPPAFLTTFVRSDRERKATRVYVALWDPRQIELHMMAGTVEPKGATGEAGPGLIPRTPEVLRRVVAASNAGFQALHGEFGMMADGVVYLPPKPYAATVAELRDGSTAFGSWPADESIPESILSYRQNMTVMVEDQKFNPYNRSWWGGTPPGWADKTHTVRTGICLTKESFVAYFYGAEIGPEALAQAMIQARCSYGIALDMNAGHSGLEFYKVAPAEEFPSLGRPMQNDWEAEGEVPGLEGWKFRGRRLIRGMGLMHFPRYIKREGRDFFYMTLRHVLPGAPLSPVITAPKAGEGEWRLKGLPQHGFPYALALTDVRIDPQAPDREAHVLKIDPHTVHAIPAASPADAAAKIVAVLDAGDAALHGDAMALWHSSGAFSIAPTPPVPEAVRLATGLPSGSAVAAVGVEDDGGMLVYIELDKLPQAPSIADGHTLDELLKHMGCSSRLLLEHPLSFALGGDTDLAGAAVRRPSGGGAVRLERVPAAGGRRIMTDTPVVPFSTWYPLQQKRIRYFKKPESAAPAADGAEPEP